MRIERYFTSEGEDVFASVSTRTISIEICHDVAARRLCIPHFEVPSFWSDAAATHLAQHFARRKGVPSHSIAVAEEGVLPWLQRRVPAENAHFGCETSLRQIVHRVVGALTYWGWNQGYFDTESDARAFYDEQAYLMLMQRAVPAAPQWQSGGLHWAYGISSDTSGGYYIDAASGELCEAADSYERPQLHHYFVHGIGDALSGDGGIADVLQQEMRVFKHGSSSGCNVSAIRSAAETLSNGAPSAGVIPFLEIGDKALHAFMSAVRSTESSHATPLRLSMIDADHPDVLRLLRQRLAQHREQVATSLGASKQRLFYQWLMQAVQSCRDAALDAYDPAQNVALFELVERLKARQFPSRLIEQYLNEMRASNGEVGHFGDDALPSEQAKQRPSQLGIRLSDAFLRQAVSGQQQTWPLTMRTEPHAVEHVNAQHMLSEIAHFNWMTGDGLVMFSDSINRWNGCSAQGEIRAASAGGAFAFLDNSACDVAVINLLSCVNESGELSTQALEHTARLCTIACDIATAMAQFPSAEIAYNSYRFRPVGLSLCNAAAMLMAMGYAYDSAEGRSIVAAAAAIVTGKGYCASAEIARELGSFEAFGEVREGMMQLMWQHHEAAFGRTQHLGSAETCPQVIDHHVLPDGALGDAVQRVWDCAMIAGDEFGYSNAQISLVGAHPNASRLMDVMSHGIDALDAAQTCPKSASHVMQRGLAQLGYSAQQASAIAAYAFGCHQMQDAGEINSESLMQRGFTATEIALIEDALARGMEVHSAFDPLHVGERFCRSVLHLSDAQLYDANFKLLYHLGYDEDAVQAFERSIEGHHTVIGAPYLRVEDAAVFATAQPNRKNSVSVEAQIRMAATVQPYLSGGIAQRILTAWDVPVKQHRQWMQMAWQLGLKQIHLQRADAPSQQPQAQQIVADVALHLADAAAPTMAAVKAALPKGLLQLPMVIHRSVIAAMGIVPAAKTARFFSSQIAPAASTPQRNARPLPARRHGYVQEALVGGISVRHRTEEYDDGSLALLALELPDLEMNLQRALQHHAALISIALQYGVPLDAFEVLASDASYMPSGAVEGHREITLVQSITDYLLKDLLPRYASQSNSLEARLCQQVEQEMQAEAQQSAPYDAPAIDAMQTRDVIDVHRYAALMAAAASVSQQQHASPRIEMQFAMTEEV